MNSKGFTATAILLAELCIALYVYSIREATLELMKQQTASKDIMQLYFAAVVAHEAFFVLMRIYKVSILVSLYQIFDLDGDGSERKSPAEIHLELDEHWPLYNQKDKSALP